MVDALEQLRYLIDQSKDMRGPSIMVGSGLNQQNSSILHKRLLPDAYYFGSGVRIHQSFDNPIDPNLIKSIKRLLFD